MQRRLRQLLGEGHPLPLLIEASAMIELTTERPTDRLELKVPGGLSLEELVAGLTEIDLPESSALLYAFRALLPPGEMGESITAELSRRNHRLPDWVEQIDRIEIVSTAETRDHLNDGDNIYLTARWPSDHKMTIWPYIDHNLGTVVKDGLAAPVGVAELGEALDVHGEDDVWFDFIDPADARARIESAIAKGERYYPPFATESWPEIRPLLEWAVSLLPAKGEDYLRPNWSDGDRQELLDAFLRSPLGTSIAADVDPRNIVGLLITHGCDFGSGDPMRWSPVVVEVVLADFFPNRVAAGDELPRKVPEVLRAFIRYCHGELSIPQHLTEETVEAVAFWDDATAQAGAYIDSDEVFEDMEDRAFAAAMLGLLADEAGGVAALHELDATPHPDEEFDWLQVPERIRDKAGEVLQHTDRCCEKLFDVEYRTILQRLLARTAAGDPDVFARRRSDIIARTLVWMVGTANHAFSESTLTVKALTAWFGLKGSPTSFQAAPFRAAVGVTDPYDSWWLDATLLHSQQRARTIRQRDEYIGFLETDEG